VYNKKAIRYATCRQEEAHVTLRVEPQKVDDSHGFNTSDLAVSQIEAGRKFIKAKKCTEQTQHQGLTGKAR
jgi:hypothetical protein